MGKMCNLADSYEKWVKQNPFTKQSDVVDLAATRD
eukprot:gene7718-5390_t